MSDNRFSFSLIQKRQNQRWVADDVSDDKLQWLVKLNSSWHQSWAVQAPSSSQKKTDPKSEMTHCVHKKNKARDFISIILDKTYEI